jgi:hypothetical protein
MHSTKWIAALFVATGLVGGLLGAQSPGTLSGTILGPEGNPLPGVTVTAKSPVSQRKTAETQQNGTFTISNLPSGSYNIEIRAVGYRSVAERNVDVAVGTRTTLNITMERSRPKD